MEAGNHGSTEQLTGGLVIILRYSWEYVFGMGARHHCKQPRLITNVQNMRVRDSGKLMDQSQEGKRRRDQN